MGIKCTHLKMQISYISIGLFNTHLILNDNASCIGKNKINEFRIHLLLHFVYVYGMQY